MNVTWFELIADRPPIRYDTGIELPEFNIMGINHSYCDGTYMYAIMDAHRYKIGRLGRIGLVGACRESTGI